MTMMQMCKDRKDREEAWGYCEIVEHQEKMVALLMQTDNRIEGTTRSDHE